MFELMGSMGRQGKELVTNYLPEGNDDGRAIPAPAKRNTADILKALI